MSKKIANVSIDQVDNEALWVIKFNGYRSVDTYPNLIKRYGKGFCNADDDIRDVDFLCFDQQPESLRGFFNEFDKITREYGWMTIPDMFDRFGIEDNS